MTNEERELRIKNFQLAAEIEYYNIMIRGYSQLRIRNNNVWPSEADRIVHDAFNIASIEKEEEYKEVSAMLSELTH